MSGQIGEIINPSDPYTLEVFDLAGAAAALLLLGEGYYALTAEDGTEIVPLFMFADEEFIGKWFAENTDKESLVEALKDRERIARHMESVVLGSFGDRTFYMAAIGELPTKEARERFAATWLDRRSSMNNIGGRAQEWAKRLRDKQEVAI